MFSDPVSFDTGRYIPFSQPFTFTDNVQYWCVSNKLEFNVYRNGVKMTSYPFISYTGSGNGYNIVSPPAPKSYWHGEYMIELKATLIHG